MANLGNEKNSIQGSPIFEPKGGALANTTVDQRHGGLGLFLPSLFGLCSAPSAFKANLIQAADRSGNS